MPLPNITKLEGTDQEFRCGTHLVTVTWITGAWVPGRESPVSVRLFQRGNVFIRHPSRRAA